MATRVRYIDLYSLYDDMDANVIENLLLDYDIICKIREFDAFSADKGASASTEKRISVEEDKVESAKEIIMNARKDGIISEEGRFELDD